MFLRTVSTIVSFLLRSSCLCLCKVKKLVHVMLWPQSPCVMSRTTLGSSQGLLHLSFPYRLASSTHMMKQAAQILIPYFVGLDSMHCLKGQQPLNGISCSSTVMLCQGLFNRGTASWSFCTDMIAASLSLCTDLIAASLSLCTDLIEASLSLCTDL